MSKDLVEFDEVSEKRTRFSTGAFLAPIPPAEMHALFEASDLHVQERLQALSPADQANLFRYMRHLIQRQEGRFASMLEISSALGATFDRDAFIELIMDNITRLMKAERSTLFLVDSASGELWSRITQGVGNAEIVLQPGEGIAGWVAQTGKSINIRDAYNDPRFHRDIDVQTGFRTHSMVCQPLRNLDGEIIGVVQVLNSRRGNFNDEDENLLSAIASQVAVAIENSSLYLSVLEKNVELLETQEKLEHKIGELDLLFDIHRQLSQTIELDALVESITRKTLELIDGKISALTLKERDHHRAYIMIDRGQGDDRHWEFYTRTVAQDGSIASRVIESKEPFLCQAGSCEEVPGPSNGAIGLPVDNVIAVPLLNEGECIGALEVFNLVLPDRQQTLGFTDDDVKVLTLIGSQIAGAVATRRRQETQEKEHRLAAIGQMISGILHDFKTPFAIISGYVQLMAETEDSATRLEYAENVLNQFRQLNQMTRELLMFARGDTKMLLRKVFLNQFIDEVRELLEKELAARKVELDIKLDYGGEAWLDVAKMKRAILNLARNAADAMATGGSFAMHVWHDVEPDEIVFTFGDKGRGIPLEIRDHIFESFVTEGKADGTGLGLAVVKKIVDDHEGTITFDSALGQGTTFIIRIPRKK
ncbi:MAG: GAF domain-containing protein [Bradymonadaceae bacterium]